MYANWFWHRPLQLVIDAGEGLALALGTQVFAPAVVAITHGHSDHVLGLPGFAGARRFGKGATTKPWTLLFPVGTPAVEAMRAAIAELWRGVDFPITWTPLQPGARVPLRAGLTLEAFAVTHIPGQPALGYRVLESRRRLKSAFDGLPESELERLAHQHGRAHLMEPVEHVVFAHSGDAMPIDPQIVSNADLLVHDATFLAAADRREPVHATTEEALALARAAMVKTLVLTHLSIRYDRQDAIPRIGEQVVASGFTGACWLLDDGEFHAVRV
jgi:ribonuclease Z